MTIEKYGERNWAVYDDNGELVCITVYKKGANEVVKRLEESGNTVSTPPTTPTDIKRLIKEIKHSYRQFLKLTNQIEV